MKSKCCTWMICVALGIAALTGCGASSTTETTEAMKDSGGFPVLDESDRGRERDLCYRL